MQQFSFCRFGAGWHGISRVYWVIMTHSMDISDLRPSDYTVASDSLRPRAAKLRIAADSRVRHHMGKSLMEPLLSRQIGPDAR